jgi:hypothetical protein
LSNSFLLSVALHLSRGLMVKKENKVNHNSQILYFILLQTSDLNFTSPVIIVES